jgi:hypothetical protein
MAAGKLASGDEKERGEHREPILGLMGARAVVRRLGGGNEAATEMEIGGGSA